MNVPRALGMIAVFCTLIFIGAACVRTVPPATDIPVVDGSDPSGVLYQQAEGYYRNRFYEKALERYMRIVESNPRSEFAAPSLYKIAGIYMKSKSYEKAVLYFDKLSSEYPRSQFAVEAFYNKGYCYLKLGDPKRGIDALKDYLARSEASHPQRARIYLAEAHVAVGDYDKALVSYGMASTGKVTNTWAKWAPSSSSVGVWWLAFSSTRDYGAVLINSTKQDIQGEKHPQIWITAIRLDLLAKGKDPSHPAFWLPGQRTDSGNHIPFWTRTLK